MKVKQLPLPLTVLSTLLFVATNAHAFKMSNLLNGIIVDEIIMSRHLEEADSDEDDDLRHSHVSDAVIITIAAWLVAVVVSLFFLKNVHFDDRLTCISHAVCLFLIMHRHLK